MISFWTRFQDELGKVVGHTSTLEASFEALSKLFLDRLDIFSNAIDLPDTLSALVFREYNTGAPQAAPRVFDSRVHVSQS